MEDGYYWIRQELPVTDGAGLIGEKWGPLMLAHRVGVDWYPLQEGVAVADQFSVAVLGERLVEPLIASQKAEHILAVVEQMTYVEGGDRLELLRAIEKILRGLS
jgi:hypothetical protein